MHHGSTPAAPAAAEGTRPGKQRRELGTSQKKNYRVSPEFSLSTGQKGLFDTVSTSHNAVVIMRGVRVCFCLLLLLPCLVRSQRSGPVLSRLDPDTQRDTLAVGSVLNSLLQAEQHHTALRQERASRPASQVPKRAQQGSRFALSLDVPTSILSVLIDLAKNQDMRTKAAANAELMARIGRRK